MYVNRGKETPYENVISMHVTGNDYSPAGVSGWSLSSPLSQQTITRNGTSGGDPIQQFAPFLFLNHCHQYAATRIVY